MKNKTTLLSIGSGGMNILNDIKTIDDNFDFLYINKIDNEAIEQGLTPIFENIDEEQKIILDDEIEAKLSETLKDIQKINIIITLGGQISTEAPKILKYIINNLNIDINIYATTPFDFEEKTVIKRASDTLKKIKQLNSDISLFDNNILLKKATSLKMDELFKTLSKDIYTKIVSKG